MGTPAGVGETRNRIGTGELVRVGGLVFRCQDFFALSFEEQMQLLHGGPRATPKHRETVAPPETGTLSDWRRYRRALRAEMAGTQQLALFGDDPDVLSQKLSRQKELVMLIEQAQKKIQIKAKENQRCERHRRNS
jgi:hypothetical protein